MIAERPQTTVETPIEPKADKAKRDNNLNLMRWVLAVGVVFSHSWEMRKLPDPLARHINHQANIGALAVMAFFLISGYLILQSRDRSACTCDYFRKRALRIYPAYAAVFLVPVLIWRQSSDPQMFAMLHGTHPSTPFTSNPLPEWCGTVWTLPWEGLCYVAVAVVASIGISRSKLAIGAVAAVCYGYYIISGTYHQGQSPLQLFVFFSIGAAWYRLGMKSNRIAAIIGALTLLVVGSIGMFMPVLARPLAIAEPLAIPPILFYLAFEARVVKWTREDYSYGTYLWGWPAIQLWIWVTGNTFPSWAVFLLAFATVTPIAAISWQYIEKPALALKSRPIH